MVMVDTNSTFHGKTLNHDEVIPLIPGTPPQSSENHDDEEPPAPVAVEVSENPDNERPQIPPAMAVITDNNVTFNNVQLNNVVEAQEEQSLVVRCGPAVRDYLIAFLDYLRRRTGFRLNHFRAPTELQNTLHRVSQISLPLTLFDSFMNVSIRLFSMNGIVLTVENAIDAFITVLSVVVDYCLNNFLLGTTLRFLSFLGVRQLTELVILLYHFFHYSAIRLWEYAQKKLKQLLVFAAGKIQAHSQLQLRND